MLDTEDQDLLLSIPDNPHSDYNEEFDGYPNYWVYEDEEGNSLLYVSLSTDDREISGNWKLTYIDSDEDDE